MATKQKTEEQNGTDIGAHEYDQIGQPTGRYRGTGTIDAQAVYDEREGTSAIKPAEMDIATAQQLMSEYENERRRRYMAEIAELDKRYGLTIRFKLFYTDDGRTQAVKTVEELRQ